MLVGKQTHSTASDAARLDPRSRAGAEPLRFAMGRRLAGYLLTGARNQLRQPTASQPLAVPAAEQVAPRFRISVAP